MGFLSKLGKLDPLGGALHKIDPLGKYDPVGNAIYGSGGKAAGDMNGMAQLAPNVSGWTPEMQQLNDYYAKAEDTNPDIGVGKGMQSAVGWNPGQMTQSQIFDQFGAGYGQGNQLGMLGGAPNWQTTAGGVFGMPQQQTGYPIGQPRYPTMPNEQGGVMRSPARWATSGYQPAEAEYARSAYQPRGFTP